MTTLKREHGHSLVELAVVSAIFMAVLAISSGVLTRATATTRFAELQSQAIDDGRTAIARLQRDIRGSNAIWLCSRVDAPTGYCLRLWTYLGNGQFENIQYRVVGSTMYRDRGCDSGTWTGCTANPLPAKLQNRQQNVHAFICDASQQSVGIRVDLILSPLSTDSGEVRLRTTARPRNVTTKTC